MKSGAITYTLIVLLILPCNSLAQTLTAADLNALRAQIEEVKANYEMRIQALEMQLQTLQAQIQTASKPPETPAPQAPAAEVPAGAQGAGGPSGTLPVYRGSEGSKIFNPDIAVIGNFLGAVGSNKVNPQPTLEMRESEVSFQAIVDPYARGDFFLSFGEEGVELEEGYVTFPALPGGLLAKVGKMRAAFGKVNTYHAHQLPWTDRPLVTDNLLGGDEGITDAGISVARLIKNPWVFLEATGQVYRGDSENVFHSF